MILNLTKHRKAHMWMDDLPLRLLPSNVLTLVVPVENEEATNPGRVAAEYYVPTGPKIHYGLLGAEFVPGLGKQLTIEVYLSDLTETPTEWTPINNLDTVIVGLSSEYANGVFDGAVAASSKFKLGAGLLRFNCAAHGRSSSSSNFFKRLAIIVVRCLQLEINQTQEQETINLLEDTNINL